MHHSYNEGCFFWSGFVFSMCVCLLHGTVCVTAEDLTHLCSCSRTAQDFTMMKDMKTKLNPKNAVSLSKSFLFMTIGV